MDNRYARQILFNPIGMLGQEKLKASTVMIIGCGALGSVNAEMLVRAGIGKLILADRDYVEPSNLQRQQLFTERDAIRGTPKVIAAERALKAIRSDVAIEPVIDHIDGKRIEELGKGVDIIVDGTDNFETRLVMNDLAWKIGIPWIYGACVGSSSAIFTFVPGESVCFRCLLPVLPAVNETCDTVGIIAPTVQITAAHQCSETLKWLSGNKTMIRKKMLTYDVWNNIQIEASMKRLKNKACETCGTEPSYPALTKDTQGLYTVLCGRDTVQIIPEKSRILTSAKVEEVANRLNIPYRKTSYFIEMKVKGYRCILFANGRLLIHGLKDIPTGRKLYHHLFG